jgi:hypothetical protein
VEQSVNKTNQILKKWITNTLDGSAINTRLENENGDSESVPESSFKDDNI